MERLGEFPPQKPGSATHGPTVTLTPTVGVVVSLGPVGTEPPLSFPPPPPPHAAVIRATTMTLPNHFLRVAAIIGWRSNCRYWHFHHK